MIPNENTAEADEFERLLNDFINCEMSDYDSSDDEDTDNIDDDSADEDTGGADDGMEDSPIQITDVLIAFSPDEEYGGCFTQRGQFRLSSLKDAYVHAEIVIHNPYYRQFRWSRKFWIALVWDGEEVFRISQTFQMNCQDALGKMYVSFPAPDEMYKSATSPRHELFIIVYHNDDELYHRGVQLVDIPEHYTSCFQYESFALYRNNVGEEIDYTQPGRSQNCFKQQRLGSILMAQGMENLLWKEEGDDFSFFVPEFEMHLYDETGRLKATELKCADSCEAAGKKYFSLCWEIGGGKRNFWAKGGYLVEVRFMDETVISAPFEVGSKDVESLYGRESIQPKKNIAGKKIVHSDKVENPLQALNAMIGLTNVKRKVEDYRNLMLLEQKRNAMGLPTQPHSLHAAFIGNPGTGKTTVARLFGKILKEMGILSKGHVVFEERSTLLGQYYSSEGEKTIAAMQRAQGGILFIDEAYTLYKPEDPKDPGMNILETLLTALADESNRDWMLLLAGYPAEMKKMLYGNPGLDSRIPESNRYYFDDYNVDELMQIAESYCRQKCYRLTREAHKALQGVVKRAYALRDETFGNGRYIEVLLTNEVLQRMAHRVNAIPSPNREQLTIIEKEDIPAIHQGDYKKSLNKLHGMIGLNQLKKSVNEHLNFMNLMRLRSEQGIHTPLPPMHMVFTGNPGTGKTTVADFIGEIYAAMGLLSKGNVLRVERSDLVGKHVGETEQKTKAILKNAQGNVLFIDEAYTLLDKGNAANDFGIRAIETLLTTLSREETDLLVIMAGYPEEMNQLLEANPGLKSRFPYIFHFEDYTAEELLEIAEEHAKRNGYRFSSAATKALKELLTRKVAHKDRHFGNGRFVTRLISTQIIPAMGSRVAALPPDKLKNKTVLQTILKQDIPTTVDGLQEMQAEGFDEKSIARSLRRLDKLVGLAQVKKAIHDFVNVSRYLHSQGLEYTGNGGPLKWSFTGNTGTGKSTVAGILAELLRAMNLLEKGHLVELKAEEIYNVQEYKVDEILQTAMKRSRQGLLFVDGDAPVFKQPQSHFDGEKLRLRLTSLMAQMPGSYALIIAEHETIRQPLVNSLSQCGVVEFDHTLHFEDYSSDELMLILKQMLKARHLKMEEEAQAVMARYIGQLCANRELGYANARTMKLIARAIANIALLRESKQKPAKAKGTVQAIDVEGFVWMDIRKKVGFK